MINLLKWTSILSFVFPALLWAQSSTSEINPDSRETIKIESERALTVTLGRTNISNLTFNDNKIFSNENSLGLGYQHFISNRMSLDANMNFTFNREGEQTFYAATVMGTFHRPLYQDKLNLRAAMGLSFSQYSFTYQENSVRTLAGKNQVSWLSGVASLGLEYKITSDLSLQSSVQLSQAGLSELDNDAVKGTSFMLQPIGITFYY